MGNELYRAAKERSQQIMNEAFDGTVFFAFSDKQFREGMEQIGAKSESELYSLNGTGGFYKKSDAPKIRKAFKDMEENLDKALQDGGEEYAFQMFSEELEDHEFGYTGDIEDTLDALGYERHEIGSNPVLFSGLTRALERYDITPRFYGIEAVTA